MRKARGLVFLVIGVVLIAVATGSGTAIIKAVRQHLAKPVTTAQAIAYVKAQLGKPYLWGGTGPGAFDCSGLIYEAYRWPASLRTSQQQWARLHHVDKPEPGDLVFFHGYLKRGEAPPGHVGIVVGPHEMIDAYAAGFPVEYDSFGLSTSKQGLSSIWGYASP